MAVPINAWDSLDEQTKRQQHVYINAVYVSCFLENFRLPLNLFTPKILVTYKGIVDKICNHGLHLLILSMRGSRNFRQGGPGQTDKKALTTLGSNFFQGGGGGKNYSLYKPI